MSRVVSWRGWHDSIGRFQGSSVAFSNMDTEATIFELEFMVKGNDWIGYGFEADSERVLLVSLGTDYEEQIDCLLLQYRAARCGGSASV